MKDWDERSVLDQMWIMSGLVLLAMALPVAVVLTVVQVLRGEIDIVVVLLATAAMVLMPFRAKP